MRVLVNFSTKKCMNIWKIKTSKIQKIFVKKKEEKQKTLFFKIKGGPGEGNTICVCVWGGGVGGVCVCVCVCVCVFCFLPYQCIRSVLAAQGDKGPFTDTC